MIIDTHAHYDHRQYNGDRDSLIRSLPQNDVNFVINVGSSMNSSRASVRLAGEYEFFFASVGVHPHEAKSLDEEKLAELKALCNNKKVVAYGEIGLDFFHNFSPPDVQHVWFQRQLGLAHELDLPVIIHSRDAAEDVFDVIKDSSVRKGVIHSFSGDAALALRYINLGFYIGIGGVVTFNKAGTLKAAVEAVPLERIVLETDCPYLTPVPNRGKRNDSLHLTYIANEIAKIKGVSFETICAKTTENALNLFNLEAKNVILRH